MTDTAGSPHQPGASLRKKCEESQEMSGQVLVRAKQVEVVLFGEPSEDQSGASAKSARGLIGDTTDGLYVICNNLAATLEVLDRIYDQIAQ